MPLRSRVQPCSSHQLITKAPERSVTACCAGQLACHTAGCITCASAQMQLAAPSPASLEADCRAGQPYGSTKSEHSVSSGPTKQKMLQSAPARCPCLPNRCPKPKPKMRAQHDARRAASDQAICVQRYQHVVKAWTTSAKRAAAPSAAPLTDLDSPLPDSARQAATAAPSSAATRVRLAFPVYSPRQLLVTLRAARYWSCREWRQGGCAPVAASDRAA